MAQRDTVTLISPDGREYSTDLPAEVTTLVTGYGYRRKRETAPEPMRDVPADDPPDDPPEDEPDDQ